MPIPIYASEAAATVAGALILGLAIALVVFGGTFAIGSPRQSTDCFR
jgi:hypothetical protein